MVKGLLENFLLMIAIGLTVLLIYLGTAAVSCKAMDDMEWEVFNTRFEVIQELAQEHEEKETPLPRKFLLRKEIVWMMHHPFFWKGVPIKRNYEKIVLSDNAIKEINYYFKELGY